MMWPGMMSPGKMVRRVAVLVGLSLFAGCKGRGGESAPGEKSSAPAAPPSAAVPPAPAERAETHVPPVPPIPAGPHAGLAPTPAQTPPVAPPAPPGNVRAIGVTELVELLRSRNELRALTLDTAGARFAGLVPAFDEKAKDEESWEFEGSNDQGLVRVMTLTFVPASAAVWTLRSVSVRLHTEDPRRTFDEIRRAATARLKKAKWMDLSARDRTAWTMGGGWELVATVLEDGDIHLRAGGPPPR